MIPKWISSADQWDQLIIYYVASTLTPQSLYSCRSFIVLCNHGDDGLVAKSCPVLVTPWTVADQAPLSMQFSRPEYWSELPFPSPEDLPDPGIKPASPKNVYNSVKQFLIGAYICFTIFVYIKKMFSTVCIFYIIFSLRKRFWTCLISTSVFA